ncbi:hypothetical protein ABIA71_002681 [Stenotrophomonas sp. 2619]|uniref:hypothetical protein n=1 Tax=Stenotrophomonas sp. 2619 TaxID=3156316 RepID=UPI0033999DCC
MDLRPLYPRATAPAVLALPRVACGGLARTLLLHGVGAHPASRAALRKALRSTAQAGACQCCPATPRSHPCTASPVARSAACVGKAASLASASA